MGRHHLFDDLLFELRAIDWHEFHLSRPLSGLDFSLQETGQLSLQRGPSEMQAVGGFGKKDDAFKIFPQILSAAVVHGKADSVKN